MRLEVQIANKIRSKLTRENLEKIEERVLEKADKLKNQNTKIGKPPSDRSTYVRGLSRAYARKTGKSYANMRGKTNNIEKTNIIGGKNGSSLKFIDSKSAVIFNYHDKGTAKGGKKREIYPKKAPFVDKRLIQVIKEGIIGLYNG